MMGKEVINLPGGPQRPYSQAVRAGDFVFVSGAEGTVNPATGEKVTGIQAQTRQCLENIKRVLTAAGTSIDNAVKCTVFITTAEHFQPMNEVYWSFFGTDLPARSTVVTGLVRSDMLVEIECIAYRPD